MLSGRADLRSLLHQLGVCCAGRGWEQAGSLLAPGNGAFFLLLCCCKIAKGWDVSFPSRQLLPDNAQKGMMLSLKLQLGGS